MLQMRKRRVIRSCGPTLADGSVSFGETESAATACTVTVTVRETVVNGVPSASLYVASARLLMIVPAETDSSKARAEELVLDTSSIASTKIAKRLLMSSRQSISQDPVESPNRLEVGKRRSGFRSRGTGNRRVAFGDNGFCLNGG